MNAIDILVDDYHTTLGFIDKCDDHLFKIRNWALVASSAVIAYSISTGKAWLPLISIVFLMAFLYLELIYKSFQDAAIKHSNDLSVRIDKHFSEPGIGNPIHEYKHGFGRHLRYPSVVHVFTSFIKQKHWHILSFYALLAIFSVAACVVALIVA